MHALMMGLLLLSCSLFADHSYWQDRQRLELL
jgi:hypothetical protein